MTAGVVPIMIGPVNGITLFVWRGADVGRRGVVGEGGMSAGGVFGLVPVGGVQ